jgi:acetolactate synthase I/II/III large subunit
MYSASTALLEALGEAGVTHIFANFGSDHPALVEAIAEARAHGRALPTIVTSPNEMVALSCAHGAAQLTGRAQAVIVHVECGTQALGGAVHNAAKGRVPVFIFAGLSPFTQEGEMRGGRNEFIQWIQDVADQRGIVRGYMKYSNEFRTGKNIPQLVHRAMQIAHSDPKGPVYLTGAREAMEEEIKPVAIDPDHWRPLPAVPLPKACVSEIATALMGAARPLVVTTYLGRKPEAVRELLRLCETLGVGVLESVPTMMNYPHDAAMYQGNHWNHPFQNPRLAEADVVLVIDSDVPWIPTINRPADAARIFHIDIDPLKDSIPLWYIKAHRSLRADAATALSQINAHLDRHGWDEAASSVRIRHYAQLHRERTQQIEASERPDGDTITPEFLTASIRNAIDADTVILNEGITNYPVICDHIGRTKPLTLFASGGGSLGWSGGAAVGMKLAAPDKTFVALTGDGSYMFSIPGTVHWMARRYRAPYLHVVYNNRGWKAPKSSALAVHPDGYASRAADIDVSFDPPPDYAGIAAAGGGAFARIVKSAGELESAIQDALRAVREEGRSAVLDVWLPPL